MLRRLNLLLAITLIVASTFPAAAAPLRDSPVSSSALDDQVADLLDQMNPDEIVGQLFLVAFSGDDLSRGTDVATLVSDWQVGGVVLSADHDNFNDESRGPTQVLALTNGLQNLTHAATLPDPRGPGGEPGPEPDERRPYVPLFIAVNHEGDGFPFTQLRSGTTPLPNALALGATWSRPHAEEIGRIAGQELAAMGLNMLLGPSLDVVNNPRPEAPGELGTRTFGGNPYWVGELGSAYVRGVHTGAAGRIAIVSKHFPGQGGSDRRTTEEVATVRRTLEELRQVELIPFVSVTGGVGDDTLAMTDALLTAHIRFQGFQGSSPTTAPISLDRTALETLLALPEFATWRANGGLLVSDSLGALAIKRFYAAQGLTEFPNRQIARDAFFSGTDVLVLSDFAGSSDWSAQFDSIKDTIGYFRERYSNDLDFKARVDAAAARVLRLKLALYGDADGAFDLERVLVPSDGLNAVGTSRDQVFQVARDAVTLLWPEPEFLIDRLPSPPSRDEDLVIVTDVREEQQCSACQPRPLIAVDALETTIVRLYGSSGQVDPARIESYSFADLKDLLALDAGSAPSPEVLTRSLKLQSALTDAEWVLFAMLDVTSEVPHSDAVKAFLSQRPELVSGKKVIVMSYSAPYYLDTTEVSKLTAYYAAYSKSEPFVDASIRALFQELPLKGVAPVSIDGISYDLSQQLSPDPLQDIGISLAGGNATPVPVNVGDALSVTTSLLVDHHGHPVPDGTLVRFHRVYPQEGIVLEDVRAFTRDGIAMADIPLERPGTLEITASSEPAIGKSRITIAIPAGTGPVVPTITTVQPTATPTKVLPTATGTPEPSPGPTTTPQPTSTPDPTTSAPRVTFLDLLGALVGIGALGVLGFWYGRNGEVEAVDRTRPGAPRAWASGHRADAAPPSLVAGLRWALLVVAGGLLGYNAYALGFPGTELLTLWLARWAAVALAWIGAALGLVAAGLLNRGGDSAGRYSA